MIKWTHGEDEKTEQTNVKDKKEKKGKCKKRIRIIISLIVIFLIILFFSTIFAIVNLANSKIVSGVSIQGIDVSNMEKSKAIQMLTDLTNNVENKQILLKYNDLEYSINIEELNLEYNIALAVENAYNIGRDGNIFENNLKIIKSKLFTENIELTIDYDSDVLSSKISSLEVLLPGVMQEYSYYIEDEDLIITKGKAGIVINKEELESQIIEEIYKFDGTISIINVPVIEKEPAEIDIEKIYNEIYKEAEDAYVTQEPLTVHPNVNGVDFAITIEEASKILMEDQEEYVIPLKITIADITISDLGEEAFPNTLGTFTTIYDASNKNRSNNVQLASEKINGTVIMPGETFSYNQIVGKRTIEAGFKEAGAYAGGQVIQEVGGGICQVSSTLYNAVLYANLEIVERSNHYFQSSYVDAGRDATVSWGTVDFKFKNNRTYPIKVEASSKNGVCKVTIKGINEETEYEVVISSKITSIIQKSTKYEEDSSLESTVEKVTQEGHNGCTSQAYKTLKLNGVTISTELLSSDYYHALDKIIVKGTKVVEQTTEETGAEPSYENTEETTTGAGGNNAQEGNSNTEITNQEANIEI